MKRPDRQSGVVQSLYYAVANIAGSALSAISLIVLSRALGPVNFGAFSVAFSLTQVVARIGDLGLSVSMQRFLAKHYHHDQNATAAAIAWSLKIKLVAGLVAFLSGLLLGKPIGLHIFKLADPRYAILGIGLASIIILYEFMVLLHQSIHQFKIAALLNAIQAGLKFIFAVVILVTIVPSGLVSYLWYGSLPAIAMIIGWQLIPKKFRHNLSLSAEAKQSILHTAKFSYIAALAITVADQLDVLMVKTMLDEYATGLFAAASRIGLIFTMFAMSIGSVLNTRVAKYKHHYDLSAYFKKSYWVIFLLLIATPILILLAKPLLLISAGSAYLPALPVVRLMLLAASITMATIPLIALFYSLDYPRYFMISGLLTIFITIGSNYLLIPLYGIEGSAWAKIIMRLIIFIYTAAISYKLMKEAHEI